jgi:magnesium-transporting ATPase (P-type)
LQAVLVAAHKYFRKDLRATWQRLEEAPFDSSTKIMAVRCQQSAVPVYFYKVCLFEGGVFSWIAA